MGLTNVLVLSQVTTYILGLLLSLCILIPISFHLHDFNDHCLLFSNGTWLESNGQFKVSWQSPAFCHYQLTWASLSFLICIVQTYRFLVHLCRGTESTFLSAFADVVLSISMSLMALAGALIITMGYQTWCDAIMRRFEACEDAGLNDIDKEDKINTKNFYTQFGTAQFGAWTSWVCWVGLFMFSLLQMCKYHQQENIRVSMQQERARLTTGHGRLLE